MSLMDDVLVNEKLLNIVLWKFGIKKVFTVLNGRHCRF